MPSTYNLARMNMFLHGVLPENPASAECGYLDADWPTDEETEFDVVTMNPPYSAKWSAAEGFKQDERFMDYGGKLAPKLRRIMRSCCMGFVSFETERHYGHRPATRSAIQRDEGDIRKILLRNGSIYAVGCLLVRDQMGWYVGGQCCSLGGGCWMDISNGECVQS